MPSNSRSAPERCVFVTVPGGKVVTIRDLPLTFNVTDIKEQLEVLASLPSDTFTLKRSDGSTLDDQEVLGFGASLQQGSILKVKLVSQFVSIYEAVQKNQLREVSRLSLCEILSIFVIVKLLGLHMSKVENNFKFN